MTKDEVEQLLVTAKLKGHDVLGVHWPANKTKHYPNILNLRSEKDVNYLRSGAKHFNANHVFTYKDADVRSFRKNKSYSEGLMWIQ